MEYKLVNRNIILIARFLNPSIFQSHWLIQEGIIEKEKFDFDKSIFTPQMVRVCTVDFNLLITADKLEFSMLSNEEESIEVIRKLLKKLPHVPYVAIGINFEYFYDEFSSNGIDNSIRLFSQMKNPIYNFFLDLEDKPLFGIYLSKNYQGTRLKLDIKPVIIKEEKKNYIDFNFNFHKELSSTEEIMNIIDKWTIFSEYSINLIDSQTKI